MPGALLMVAVGTFGFSGAFFWTLLGLQLAGVLSALVGWALERAGRPVGASVADVGRRRLGVGLREFKWEPP